METKTEKLKKKGERLLKQLKSLQISTKRRRKRIPVYTSLALKKEKKMMKMNRYLLTITGLDSILSDKGNLRYV